MYKTFALLLYCLFTFQSYSQSEPSVTINGLNAGEISKDSLLKLDKLDVNSTFKIISFTMVYYINGSVKELEGYAGNLSKEMREVIKKSKVETVYLLST